jgi:hypothetical protein
MGGGTEAERQEYIDKTVSRVNSAVEYAKSSSESPEEYMKNIYEYIDEDNQIAGEEAEINANHSKLAQVLVSLKPRSQYLPGEQSPADIKTIAVGTDITARLNEFFDVETFNDGGIPLVDEDANTGAFVKHSLQDSRALLRNLCGLRDDVNVTPPTVQIEGYTLTATVGLNQARDEFYNQFGINFSLIKDGSTESTKVTSHFGYDGTVDAPQPKYIIKNSHAFLETQATAYLTGLNFVPLANDGDKIPYTDFANLFPKDADNKIVNNTEITKELLSKLVTYDSAFFDTKKDYFNFATSIADSNSTGR